LAIRKSKLVSDLEEETTVYRIVTLSYHKLEVGDKLSDAHGNKGTVSAIWEDDEMPSWEGMGMKIKLHYISNPYTMKRLPWEPR
jgi:DNA-directed RNA polymerase beta subunit